MKLVFLLTFFLNAVLSHGQTLKDHILFYSSFDESTTAEIAVGDGQLYTAESYDRTDTAQPGIHDTNITLVKDSGVTGNALQFKKQIKSAIYFSGFKNLGYNAQSWNGSFSFWLKVDPNKDLAPGYCDPINLTDTKYNDAALWVDFTDKNPRQFRLGVLGDLNVWNPENKNDNIAFEKRLVTVKKPSFSNDEWTHIVITYSEINTDNSISKLFINGQFQGEVKGINDPFTWKEENAKIMLGLGYIGMIDEISAFDKPLDDNEVKSIYGLKNGIKSILK